MRFFIFDIVPSAYPNKPCSNLLFLSYLYILKVLLSSVSNGKKLIFPLEQLVEFNSNIYEITVAASRRAYQMAKINDPEIEANSDKVVCVAAKQLFNKKVNYHIEQKQ